MNIIIKKRFLLYKGYKFKCSIGKSGTKKNKREGDNATPQGIFSLGKFYYRPDRIKKVSTNLSYKKVWNYSSESETHTVETHIHRLRKKILKKFGDNNFIKNTNKGYYI